MQESRAVREGLARRGTALDGLPGPGGSEAAVSFAAFSNIVQEINLVDRFNDVTFDTPRLTEEKILQHESSKASQEKFLLRAYTKHNYDFADVFAGCKAFADIFKFKTTIQGLFALGNLGEKYLDLNRNPFAINAEKP